jgi:hypothetical protein
MSRRPSRQSRCKRDFAKQLSLADTFSASKNNSCCVFPSENKNIRFPTKMFYSSSCMDRITFKLLFDELYFIGSISDKVICRGCHSGLFLDQFNCCAQGCSDYLLSENFRRFISEIASTNPLLPCAVNLSDNLRCHLLPFHPKVGVTRQINLKPK